MDVRSSSLIRRLKADIISGTTITERPSCDACPKRKSTSSLPFSLIYLFTREEESIANFIYTIHAPPVSQKTGHYLSSAILILVVSRMAHLIHLNTGLFLQLVCHVAELLSSLRVQLHR